MPFRFAKLWECARVLASLLALSFVGPIAPGGTIRASRSQISSETRERDILDERIRRARQREHDRIGHFRGTHHFLTRPFALNLVPDFSVGRRGVNIDHANFSVAQFLAHALRKSFKGELAHAIRTPVGETAFSCHRENIYHARPRRHSRSKMLREH